MSLKNTSLVISAGACGVVAIVSDYDIEVNEFELQSRYYVHFQKNRKKKHMDPILPALR